MNVLVCIKRVPMVGARVTLTADALEVDTRQLGFAIGPHEECAVEEAIRIVESHGGSVSVLTLGPIDAAEQLREAASIGAQRLLHLMTDGREWDPIGIADAIAQAVSRDEESNGTYELILLGNEAPDTGDYQVGVRLAFALDRPCVNGVKHLDVGNGVVRAQREFRHGEEMFEIALPSVITVKEGINLPRYPSLPGRLRAKKTGIEVIEPQWRMPALLTRGLRVPNGTQKSAKIIGTGVEVVPVLVDLLEQMGAL